MGENMEFKVLEKTKDSLLLKVLDDEPSVMYPIMEQLLSEERVKDVTYSVEHADLDEPELYIKAKKGEDPSQILTDIAKDIQTEFSNLYDELFPEEE